MPNAKKVSTAKNLLERNVAAVIVKSELEAVLKSGKKLRVKHGIDPTGENIHIGRAVVLWKLREFQELGHKIILIIGDYTAEIGDPSDKLEKRPFLAKEQIKKNLKDYLPQIGKILDLEKTEVRHNSEWLSKLTFRETASLADIFPFQQILERKNFSSRLQKNQPISLREGLYPLMQGYDSVAVKADLELGGSDQLFNILAGRKIQEFYGQKPQNAITMKMLIGADGRKMSPSWGNVINIADTPENMFGKTMAIRDDLIIDYFTLATGVNGEEIKQREKELAAGENPRNIKEKLALEIVRRYHGETAAQKAALNFTKVFVKKETPSEVPTLKLAAYNMQLLNLITRAGVKSKSEARRLASQKGVKINSQIKRDPNEILSLKSGDILQIGRRIFFKID